jgi:general secretion pathway protein M
MQKLKDWFDGLNTRERVIVIAGAVLVLITAVYMLGLAPFYNAVSARAERVERKEADLAWMRSIASEVQVLGTNRPMTAAAPSNESLVVLVDRTAREAGLGTALTGQTPNGQSGIRVRMEGAPFDTVMTWLGNLQLNQAVSVESAQFDRTGAPGQVNASIVLNRAAAAG